MEFKTIRTLDIERVIRFALLVPMGDPLTSTCIWGLPLYMQGGSGVGKSRRIRSLVESMDFHFPPPIYPSQKTPDAFDGIVTPSGDIVCLIKAFRDAQESPKPSVIFVDELTGAEESVQNALLSTIWERHAGDVEIPPSTRILLAGNPVDSAAGGHVLKPPVANRLVHLAYPDPTKESWQAWRPWEPHGGIRTVSTEIAWEQWIIHLTAAKHRLDDFFTSNARMLYAQPDTADEKSAGPWPSPRSWEHAMRITALQTLLGAHPSTQHLHLNGDEYDSLIEGCVGDTAFAVFRQWLRALEEGIPRPELILANGWNFTAERPDIGRYVIRSVSTRLSNAQVPQLLELLLSASRAGLDDAVVVAFGDLLGWMPLNHMAEPTRVKAIELLRTLKSNPLGDLLLPSA